MDDKKHIKINWHKDFIELALENPRNYGRINIALASSIVWKLDKVDQMIIEQRIVLN